MKLKNEQTKKINKNKSWFFRKIHKIDKYLIEVNQGKRKKKATIVNIRNEGWVGKMGEWGQKLKTAS